MAQQYEKWIGKTVCCLFYDCLSAKLRARPSGSERDRSCLALQGKMHGWGLACPTTGKCTDLHLFSAEIADYAGQQVVR